MSWQNRALSLVKRLGPAGKFAVRTVVGHILPDNHAVVELVGQAFSAIHQTPKKFWRIRKASCPHETARDEKRLEQLLGLLEDDLGSLLVSLGQWQTRPEIALKAVETAIAREETTSSAVTKMVKLAKRFDRAKLPLARGGAHFTDFPLTAGLRFGCWCLWIKRREVGLLMINAETGTFLRIRLECNGWFEYRTNRMKPGKIFTVWSAGGGRSLETGRHLHYLERSGPPKWRLPQGEYPADQWNIEASESHLTLEHPSTTRYLQFEHDRPVWNCNDARWNEVGE